MESNIFYFAVIGWCAGLLIGLAALLFFQDELFSFLDRIVDSVRKSFRLD